MPNLTNYHTHNLYCDGDSSIESMVQAAYESGLEAIGISSHSPIEIDSWWSLKLEKLPEYVAEVRRVREQYAGKIDVALGLELDYLPGHEAFYQEQYAPVGLDYMIGSVHFVDKDLNGKDWTVDSTAEDFAYGLEHYWKGDIRALIERYYEIVRQASRVPGVAIMGHFDRIKKWNDDQRYFREDEPWYVEAIETTLAAFKQANVIVEFNTAYGRRPLEACYPSPWIVRRCVEVGVPLQINSDAHSPSQITGSYDQAVKLFQNVGYREVMRFEAGHWVPRPLQA